MSDLNEPIRPPKKRGSFTASWLRILGPVVLLLAIAAGAALTLGRTGDVDSLTLAEVAEFALYVAAGLAGGGLLVGLSALLRILKDLHGSSVRLERFQYGLSEAAGQAAEPEATGVGQSIVAPEGESGEARTPPSPPWREIIEALHDIRDDALLTEEERNEKRASVADEEIHAAAVKIRSLTAEGAFFRAREIAASITRKYPKDDRASDLVEQLEVAREEHESEDVTSIKKQVNDLVSISAWSRARALAQQLQQRHPDSAEARQLLLKIERDHRAFDEEQRRRMSAEVQRFVTKRRWEEALVAARTFIERFPGSEETEAVRMQLPTLQANAEIEFRQHLEAKIMDYAKHGRYLEAVELAKKLIGQYPDSPQAEALRGQIDRLEELATDPNAAPARVLIDSSGPASLPDSE